MRAGIHPEYHLTTVTCACGNTFVTGSTRENIRVEVCSACHPFYTGARQKIVDAGGRVERFRRRVEQAKQARQGAAARKAAVSGRPRRKTPGR
ncbi:MAG: 50S ribosomal protein L31 [Limnochordaceae bacterium]|nr:50S ribosomal protein L31 [Limnochordaceae bacterium]